MADSHPFSNAGLGMFGADAAIAKQAGTPEGASDKMKKLIGVMTGGALEATGLKDFFDKLGGGETGGQPSSGGGINVQPPLPASPSAAPDYSVAPPLPVSPQGINPMALPNQAPGGIGFNAKPAGAVPPSGGAAPPANIFQFNTTPAQPINPDEEHRNQVKSAWS